VLVQVIGLSPATSGSGFWLVDDVELDDGVDVALIGKWSAVQNAVDVLKAIDGTANGWKTNLESRVYTRLLFPTMTADMKLPYVCVPLQQESESIEYEGFAFISTWRLVGYAFFQDNPESNTLDSAGGVQAADFRDDLIKAFMADQTLSGVTENCEVTNLETVLGSSDDNCTWLIFTIEFTQHAGAQDLGIA